MTDSIERKEEQLRQLLRSFGSAIVAFSGGVDSGYLAHVANQELGARALAVTADSASYPEFQRRTALELVSRFGIRHRFIYTGELEDPNYLSNPANRCYYCKRELYAKLSQLARELGFVVVCDGTNADDLSDWRPGRKAACEFHVRSPLLECGLTKSEIRHLARRAGLPIWDLPASACLSSRIPHGQVITLEKLSTIEKAEDALRSLGFKQLRVRHHGDLARIEIAADEMARALDLDMAVQMAAALKALGFRYVALDLEGYRTGSLNPTA
jgi:uncharacterized protein